MTERVKEGIDSPVERTRARLSAARAHLRLVQAQGSADVLREHLAKLTGLKASEIETVPDSIPQMPAIPDDDADVATAAKNNPAALAAEERARAAYLRAQGEHKSLLPHVDFAGQYALLAKYNNYDVFYAHYQANNATLGVSIQFPFFSSVEHQHAAAADADAVRAKRAAEAHPQSGLGGNFAPAAFGSRNGRHAASRTTRVRNLAGESRCDSNTHGRGNSDDQGSG